jgi:O-antigen/teichoic acid export membrane protein
VADGLAIALERVDRLWTGYRLGDAALGFYSRAHTFAGFVRRISTGSVGAVAGGIFAELAGDRRALSRAVVRTFAVAIRGGLLLGGAALLVAPEFIRLALGPRWLPMLPVLRFTLAFAVMEPVSALAVTLFLVLGRPRVVVRARLLQLGTLVPGLLVLSPLLGATGVALAVDAALLVGTVAMLRQASAEVDMSPRALIARPSAALVLGLAFGGIAGAASVGWRSDWGAAAAKAAVFAIVYGGVLGALERRHLAELAGAYAQWITTRVPRRPPEDAAGPA